jgi:hypothetical protein
MTHLKTTYRRVILGFTVLATTLLIAACGSSSSTTTSTTTSTTSSASRTSFQQCMQEHGVTITSHPAGAGTATTHSGTPPAGAAGSGSANSSRSAAFKACGATGLHTSGG